MSARRPRHTTAGSISSNVRRRRGRPQAPSMEQGQGHSTAPPRGDTQGAHDSLHKWEFVSRGSVRKKPSIHRSASPLARRKCPRDRGAPTMRCRCRIVGPLSRTMPSSPILGLHPPAPALDTETSRCPSPPPPPRSKDTGHDRGEPGHTHTVTHPRTRCTQTNDQVQFACECRQRADITTNAPCLATSPPLHNVDVGDAGDTRCEAPSQADL